MLHPFIPFVTEEIYSNLPNAKESILLSDYPQYNKNQIYKKELNEVNNILEFITLFRNRKLELNIPKEFNVVTNIKDSLILKSLKLEDKLIDSGEGIVIELYDYKITIVFDDKKHKEEELLNNKKEYELLNNSIARRRNLLSNENYVSKAPSTIVNQEKELLKKEEERLLILENLIK